MWRATFGLEFEYFLIVSGCKMLTNETICIQETKSGNNFYIFLLVVECLNFAWYSRHSLGHLCNIVTHLSSIPGFLLLFTSLNIGKEGVLRSLEQGPP